MIPVIVIMTTDEYHRLFGIIVDMVQITNNDDTLFLDTLLEKLDNQVPYDPARTYILRKESSSWNVPSADLIASKSSCPDV